MIFSLRFIENIYEDTFIPYSTDDLILTMYEFYIQP